MVVPVRWWPQRESAGIAVKTEGMDLLVTTFQLKKTKISGAVSSTRRARTVSSMAEVIFNVVLCFRNTASQFVQERAVVAKTGNHAAWFDVDGHMHG